MSASPCSLARKKASCANGIDPFRGVGAIGSRFKTMPLRRTKDLHDFTIAATDADIGRIHDLYFDDRSWMIRYIVDHRLQLRAASHTGGGHFQIPCFRKAWLLRTIEFA
jgi:hypothetical protein